MGMVSSGIPVIMMLVAFLAGCGASAPTSAVVNKAAEEMKLREIESAWVQSIAARDLDQVMANYTDDAVLMTPGAPAAKGKDAIRAAWKGMIGSLQKMEFAPYRIELSKTGDFATTLGAYMMTITDPKTKKPIDDRGSYVTVYRKQADGGWKVVEDIAVSEVAPK